MPEIDTALPVESPLRITVRPYAGDGGDLDFEQRLANLPVELPPQLQQIQPTYGVPYSGTLPVKVNKAIEQTWPVRMVQSGVSLPKDVYEGKVDPLSDEGIARAQDLAGLGVVGPLAVKPGTATLGSGMVRNMNKELPKTDIEPAPPFYSAVEQAVKNAKQGSATADQWLGFLKNQPGVKPEELSYVLKDLPTGQIKKADLERHIAENKVELKEVAKGQTEFHELQYKDTLARRLTDFKEILPAFNSVEDVVIAKKRNANFRETAKGHSDKEMFEAIQEAKTLPEYGGDLFRRYDSEAEAKAAVKAYGAHNHLEEPIKRIENVETKYKSYQLPGGENYKETLLTLPQKRQMPSFEEWSKANGYGDHEGARNLYEKIKNGEVIAAGEGSNQYKSSHWDEPNVLAHIRHNDRDIPGVGKSLHIEEIQSDIHQTGRKEGYRSDIKLTKAQKEEHDDLMSREKSLSDSEKERLKELDTIYNKSTTGVPNFPFKKTWDELALKKMIRQAAENGYDAISWTPGEAQAARYDLSKQVNSIEIKNEGSANKHIVVNAKSGVHASGLVDKDGKIVQGYDAFKDAVGKPLSDVVGKEMAEKIMGKEGPYKFEGLDLKVGGEGMKAFYDKMLVDKANAIAKKFGGKVETKSLGEKPEEIQRQYDSFISSLREQAKNYYIEGSGNLTEVEKATGLRMGERLAKREDVYSLAKVLGKQHELSEWDRKLRNAKDDYKEVHVLRITPELRQHALTKGFPLFSAGLPTLTPVSHDPFKKYKLTPVEFNPFLNPNAT